MRVITLLLFLSLLAIKVQAQQVFKIVDALTGQGLPNTHAFHNDSLLAVSNTAGELSLTIPFKGLLTFSHLGYRNQQLLVDTLVNNHYEIRLSPQAIYMNEIAVTGFAHQGQLLNATASISYQDLVAAETTEGTSLTHLLNATPGIRFEERAPASYRISVRGSLLRSPFGVRNVKVYWKNIPITKPGGSTDLNLIDIAQSTPLELIKGPSSSLYGAGAYGTLLLASQTRYASKPTLSIHSQAGSFNTHRHGLSASGPFLGMPTQVAYTFQSTNGHRTHSAHARHAAQLSQQLYKGKLLAINTHNLFTHLNYEIPGGLTEEQMIENPAQARAGSEDKNASIKHLMVLGSLSLDWNPSGNKWKAQQTVYLRHRNLDHPFIFDYEQESSYEVGLRNTGSYVWNSPIPSLFESITFQGGIEGQIERSRAKNFGNISGRKDTLRFNDIVRPSQALIFSQASVNMLKGIVLVAGLSLNFRQYYLNRLYDAGLDSSYTIQLNTTPQLAGRLALSKKLAQNHYIRASVSQGFSPPTLDEIRTGEGSINTSLLPERGISTELGYRAISLNGAAEYDVTLFAFQLQQSIVNYTNANGVVLFRNAGGTRQYGVEGLLKFHLIKAAQHNQRLYTTIAATFNHFIFHNYEKRGEDFSGNTLPGTAPVVMATTVNYSQKAGLFLSMYHNYTHAIPLNDANTVYSNSYHLLNAQVGYNKVLKALPLSKVYIGANNLLNVQHSLGNDLNAFGGRYFQPAAGRSFYAGIKISLSSATKGLPY